MTRVDVAPLLAVYCALGSKRLSAVRQSAPGSLADSST